MGGGACEGRDGGMERGYRGKPNAAAPPNAPHPISSGSVTLSTTYIWRRFPSRPDTRAKQSWDKLDDDAEGAGRDAGGGGGQGGGVAEGREGRLTKGIRRMEGMKEEG